MKFYKKIYCSDSLMKKKKKICWKLKHNIGQISIFVISLAQGDDLLEIYHCAYLQQKYYKNHPPFIVGIADSYGEAVNLVQQIVEDAYEKTGTYKVKDFLGLEPMKKKR